MKKKGGGRGREAEREEEGERTLKENFISNKKPKVKHEIDRAEYNFCVCEGNYRFNSNTKLLHDAFHAKRKVLTVRELSVRDCLAEK